LLSKAQNVVLRAVHNRLWGAELRAGSRRDYRLRGAVRLLGGRSTDLGAQPIS
jgi:hypothetical protein